MIVGMIFAIMAGLLWGLIFIGPILIPEYPSVLQAAGRYITFGLISLLLSWHDRRHLYELVFNDWLEAIKLVLIGHIVYYTCLASAIQRIGAPIVTVIIGTLPVMITISAYYIERRNYSINQKLPIHVIFISILLIIMGLFCVNVSELQFENFESNTWWEYLIGILLSVISVLCWTWYALRNAYWLKTHPHNKPLIWANAQGIVTLPISFTVYFIICMYLNYCQREFILPFGPRPLFFIFLMIVIGFCCSWLGTFFWNEASQRLPITLMGPLIVFETIAGLLYAFIHRKLWPSNLILIGICLLISGVFVIFYIQQNFLKKRCCSDNQ